MNNKSIYLYRIQYIFPFPKDAAEDKRTITDHGLIHGVNYEDALRQLMTEIYNEDDVVDIQLIKVNDNATFSIPKELWEELIAQIAN